MRIHHILSILLLALCLLLTLHQTLAADLETDTTVILYDGTLGGLPETQNLEYEEVWLFIDGASETFNNGRTILNTTLNNLDRDSTYAGYGAAPISVTIMPILSHTQGYRLHFAVQIDFEDGSSNDRAGFSVFALSSDSQGVELGFWQDEIWAQHDDTTGSLFTHAEGVNVNTTALVTYTLQITTAAYTLFSHTTPILTGPLRNYTAFVPPVPDVPDPYEVPNAIFLGDNTSSARAIIQLARVAVTTNICQITPTLSTAITGNNLTLTWTEDPVHGAYQIHRSPTPYFTPTITTAITTTSSTTYTDTNSTIKDSNTNNFYLIQTENCQGSQTVTTAYNAEFDYPLTPGDQ